MNATQEDVFEARPSNRIGNQKIEADGDTWQETLAVCEAPSTLADAGKLVIRSYYQNLRSGQRVWDEPPSGASQINPASEEMRRMANLQLSELQVVTGGIPDDSPKTVKKRGFFGFRKKDKKQSQERKIQYRPGSKLFARKGTSASRASGNDVQLQEAIARSLAESRGEVYDPPKAATSNLNAGIDDEELAMAKALSMSEAEQYGESEEQVMQEVIEQSKRESTSTRRGQPRQEDDLLGLSNSQAPSDTAWPEDDRKMPAKLNKPQPASSSPLLDMSSPSTYAESPSSSAPPYVTAPSSSTAGESSKAATAPLKSPPAYSTPPNGLKSPPSGAKSPARSPVAMFDPYAKDSPAATKALANNAPQPAQRQDSGPTLHKMDEAPANQINAARLSFGKRTSTKKMQDKAGLV